ncbi:MarR family winged helix-turn-helix transcriptional regulator [Ancylobacter sp. VNQ12]|uniref:MarR family winged helix-turn-helix transcriptional regulator n=1 Tax=Ancylobacter sp. VNQ12 TaxID=3400920 RepID=UPI003C00C486
MVRVIGTRATALYEQLTGQSDITPQQFGALLTLHQKGTLTLSELASAIFVDRSTLGEMIRRMAARGLISRTTNGSDRRSTKVSITPAGTSALFQLVESAASLQNTLLAAVPREHRKLFLQCMKAIAFGSSPSSKSI